LTIKLRKGLFIGRIDFLARKDCCFDAVVVTGGNSLVFNFRIFGISSAGMHESYKKMR